MFRAGDGDRTAVGAVGRARAALTSVFPLGLEIPLQPGAGPGDVSLDLPLLEGGESGTHRAAQHTAVQGLIPGFPFGSQMSPGVMPQGQSNSTVGCALT